MNARRVIHALMAAYLVAGCESPPAFAVPPGPARSITLDVDLPVYVMGAPWAIRSFTDSLGIELAKYRIDVVAAGSQPTPTEIQVELGELTYRQWQEIEVGSVVAGRATPLGRVRLSDLGMSTVEAAAQPVAAIIARQVWGIAPAR